jgi:hypothetical protein
MEVTIWSGNHSRGRHQHVVCAPTSSPTERVLSGAGATDTMTDMTSPCARDGRCTESRRGNETMQRGLRRWGVAVAAVVAVCGLWATPAVGYVLKHPKHEHCRTHYARTQRTVNVHGHRVKQVICVRITPPKPEPAPAPSPSPAPAPTPSPAPAPSPPAPKSSAWCEASAAYSQKYENWEIFVHSNQPHRSAEARDSNGDHWSYETNSEGYADIYLDVHGNPNGQQVTVEVGEATCSTTLD